MTVQTVMMALLTSVFGLEESFGTLGMALTSGQLPTCWTTNTLVATRTTEKLLHDYKKIIYTEKLNIKNYKPARLTA